MELHLDEAARRMGFEVVEEKEESMEQTKKPHICEMDESCENCVFEKRSAKENPCVYCSEAYSSQFKRKPRFTQEEVADAQAILRWYPTASEAERGRAGHLIVGDKKRVVKAVFTPEVHILPSLHPGQSVKLEEIIGEST